jgi:hypothetical protein
MPGYNQGTSVSTCTVQRSGGKFCDAPSAPDMPFPICGRHAIQLYRQMHQMATEVLTNHRDHIDIHNRMMQGVADAHYAKENTPAHRVYYIRVGEYIKIGTTGNLKARIAAYPPGSQLLATELGGTAMEGSRHRQFAHLLAERNEWFHPGADLMDHIERLAAKQAPLDKTRP